MPRARTKLLYSKLLGTTLLVSGLTLGIAPFAPSLFTPSAHAQQRAEVRQEFRLALEPHGRFERHARYGEVWRPARVARDWRPYTVGRWVYTDDWGWYWNAGEAEADWGWVAFHYGRWVDDRDMGWVWVPGDEWGPAWVNWRRGAGPGAAPQGGGADVGYIGWAPLPPEDVIVEYRDNPDVWTFVRARDIVAPSVHTVIIRERRPEFLQRTVVVNRTMIVRDRGVIVNPGIPPAYIAAFVGRPLVSYDVRPRVIAGGRRINNAIELRADDLRDQRRLQKQRPVIRETNTRIEAIRNVPAPRALEANERGRLGDRPPRAAQGAAGDRDDRGARDRRDRQDRGAGDRQDRGPGDRQERGAGDRRGPDQRELDQRGSDRRGPDQRGPDQRGQDQRGQDRRGQDRRGPDQRGPAAPGERPSTTQDRRDLTPGQTGAQSPGRAGTAPGRDTPGQAAPGRQDRSTPERSKPDRSPTERSKPDAVKPDTAKPDRSNVAPGRDRATPGQTQTAPAQDRPSPGPSGAKPPGRDGASPNPSGAAPGRPADTSPNRGAQQREERAQPQQQRQGGAGAQRAPQRPDASEGGRQREKQ